MFKRLDGIVHKIEWIIWLKSIVNNLNLHKCFKSINSSPKKLQLSFTNNLHNFASIF